MIKNDERTQQQLGFAAGHKTVYTIVNTGKSILAKLQFLWVVIFVLPKIAILAIF
jgi:hypothetical protein